MSDTSELIAEILKNMIPDLTKKIVEEVEKKRAPKRTYASVTVQPLMECDTANWHTMTRDDRGKLRARPANNVTRRTSPQRNTARTTTFRRPSPEPRSPVRRSDVPTYRRTDGPTHRRASPVRRRTESRYAGNRRPYDATNRGYASRRETHDVPRAAPRRHNDDDNSEQSARRPSNKPQLPVPPTDFARIRNDMYQVVHYVQVAHHKDLWEAGNPVKSLTEGVRRMIGNLRPPRANKKVADKLKEEGERFLDIIQVTMLQHLRECTEEADEELRRSKPPRDEDEEIIVKQATALLRKNYGKKLTSRDVDCHMYEAFTLLTHEEQEEETLRRGDDGTTATAAAPKPSVWINNGEDDDDGAAQAQAHDDATAPRAGSSARVDTHLTSERETDLMPLPKRLTRNRRLSTQHSSNVQRGEVLVDHPSKNL